MRSRLYLSGLLVGITAALAVPLLAQEFVAISAGLSKAEADTYYLVQEGGSLTGGVTFDGASIAITTAAGQDLVMGAGGAADISVGSAAGVLIGDGTDPLTLGAAAATSHSLGATGVLVGGVLEADGAAYLDGGATLIGGLISICDGECSGFSDVAGAGDLGVEDDFEVNGDARFDGAAELRGNTALIGPTNISDGLSKLYTASAAGSIAAGTVVVPSATTSRVEIGGVDETRQIGITRSTCSANGLCYVIFTGPADVLMVNSVGCTVGDYCLSSASVAGRVDCSTDEITTVAQVMRLIGISVKTTAGGTNVKCSLLLRGR